MHWTSGQHLDEAGDERDDGDGQEEVSRAQRQGSERRHVAGQLEEAPEFCGRAHCRRITFVFRIGAWIVGKVFTLYEWALRIKGFVGHCSDDLAIRACYTVWIGVAFALHELGLRVRHVTMTVYPSARVHRHHGN